MLWQNNSTCFIRQFQLPPSETRFKYERRKVLFLLDEGNILLFYKSLLTPNGVR